MLSLGCGGWCKTPWLTLWQSTWLTPGLPVCALLKAARWHLSKVPCLCNLQVTLMSSLSRGESLSGSFICTDILGFGLSRSSLSWSPLLKCFALLYPYFARNSPCRWFLPSFILLHITTNQEGKPRPSRLVREMEAQTYLGGRVMEEAEIKRCGWLWCAAACLRPVFGTHQANLLRSVVTGEIMMPCCQGWERQTSHAKCTE